MTIKPTPKPGIMQITPYKPGKSSSDPAQRSIKLSSNENPYGASPKAIAAYQEAGKKMHRYPDGGASALRAAIAETYGLPQDKLICGAGSDELIGLLIHSYAGQGDEVLFTEHAFLMYRIYTLSAGATPLEAKESNLKTDVDTLLAAVSENTKLVFVANPNNPTGSYISEAELKRLRDGLPEHVILVVDAAYAECADADDYCDGKHLVETEPNTVMLRTFSKIYGLPALRVGWMYGQDHIVDVINRARSPFNLNASAQAAAIAAVQDVSYMKEQFRLNKEQRERLASEIAVLGWKVYPSQGNFVLVDFGSPEQASTMNAHLLADGIYVREVGNYKLPHCLRISVGTVEENDALLKQMQQFHTKAA
jgi:histidinol-phosphate aminotransferase